jgi:hypothetical protein
VTQISDQSRPNHGVKILGENKYLFNVESQNIPNGFPKIRVDDKSQTWLTFIKPKVIDSDNDDSLLFPDYRFFGSPESRRSELNPNWNSNNDQPLLPSVYIIESKNLEDSIDEVCTPKYGGNYQSLVGRIQIASRNNMMSFNDEGQSDRELNRNTDASQGEIINPCLVSDRISKVSKSPSRSISPLNSRLSDVDFGHDGMGRKESHGLQSNNQTAEFIFHHGIEMLRSGQGSEKGARRSLV